MVLRYPHGTVGMLGTLSRKLTQYLEFERECLAYGSAPLRANVSIRLRAYLIARSRPDYVVSH